MFGQRRVDPSPGTHYRSERVSAVPHLTPWSRTVLEADGGTITRRRGEPPWLRERTPRGRSSPATPGVSVSSSRAATHLHR